MTDYSCPALATPLVQSGSDQARSFQDTFTITHVHEKMPRFGHTNNLTVVINGTSEQATDYLWGILAAPILIFCIFVVWILVILVLRCLGVGRVGFWAGSMKRPSKPIEEDDTSANYQQALAEWERAVEIRETRLKRIRIAVLVSGVCIITFAIVMITMGVTALVDSLNDSRTGVTLTAGLGEDIIDLMNRFLAAQEEIVSTTNNMTATLNGFCPSVQTQLCTNTSDVNTCNLQGIPGGEEIRSYLLQGRGVLTEQLLIVRDDMQLLVDTLHLASSQLTNLNWAFWVAATFAIIVAVLTVFIIYAVIRAWCGFKRYAILACFRNLLLVPIFAFFVILSWIFSMVFIIGSVTTADACFRSPDSRVIALLDTMNFESIVLLLLTYYVSGCLQPDFPEELTYLQSNISASVESINGMGGFFSNNTGILEQTCGGQGTAGVVALATSLSRAACNAFALLKEINGFFSCANWHPLYATFAYDAICYNGNKGFTWIAWSQFLIVLFAMIMLTLRVGFADMQTEEDEKQVGQWRAWCSRTFCCNKQEADGTQEQPLTTAAGDDRFENESQPQQQ